MNLSNIFESTDFVHASGTKEELQVAEFLKAQCEALGVPARLEAFRVAMGEIESAHLFADGKEPEPWAPLVVQGADVPQQLPP